MLFEPSTTPETGQCLSCSRDRPARDAVRRRRAAAGRAADACRSTSPPVRPCRGEGRGGAGRPFRHAGRARAELSSARRRRPPARKPAAPASTPTRPPAATSRPSRPTAAGQSAARVGAGGAAWRRSRSPRRCCSRSAARSSTRRRAVRRACWRPNSRWITRSASALNRRARHAPFAGGGGSRDGVGFGWNVHLPDERRQGSSNSSARVRASTVKARSRTSCTRHNGQPVSLFMLPREARASELVQVFGHQARIWSEGDRTFVLVARESASEMEHMAALVRTTFR